MTKIKDKYREKIVGNWLKTGSLADFSGKGNPAALKSGSTFFVNTERGRVPNIDGAATEINVDPANTSYNVTGVDFSLSCWLYLRKTSGFQSIFGRMSGNNGWRIHESSGNFGYSIGVGGATTTTNTPAIFNQWVHLVATHNESTGAMNLYVKGVLKGTNTSVYQEDTSDWIGLGTENNGTAQWIDGYLQDAIIWKGLEFTGAEASQLYEEGLQEAHYDRIDIKQLSDPARQLLPDGDMEAVGTTDWTAGSDAVLTKETVSPKCGVRNLKIARDGTNNPSARQAVLAVNKLYRISGYARSDGNALPEIIIGGLDNIWTGSTSTDWQYFDVTFNAISTSLRIYSWTSTGTEYTEWDDITLQEVPNTDPVYIADGRGWNESIAAENAGFLSNTDWELNGVSTTIEDTGFGDGTKRITSSTGGVQATRPSTQAYGTWELKMNRQFANFNTVSFMHGTKFGTFTPAGGYNISYRDDGTVLLRKDSTTIVTDSTTRAVGTEIDVKITRTKAGLWELFVDGVSKGTATDTAYTTSSWCSLDIDQGCVVRDFKFIPYIE
jgi:hypothetical protein